MKRYSDSQLMTMTKLELIGMLRVAEHNEDVAEEHLRQQVGNMKDWVPVRHGYWTYKRKVRGGVRYRTGEDSWGNVHTIQCDDRYVADEAYCSECHKHNDGSSLDWCPNCGAKMDGEAEYARVKPQPLAVGAKMDEGENGNEQ